ncbi:PAS domain S-box protein [Roseimarinus sediminis]|uniref:PAS domain S-box protein n=1 Tax=Roseimarinus sediminis TaxID=1610899 RepID=UPI003D1F92E2
MVKKEDPEKLIERLKAENDALQKQLNAVNAQIEEPGNAEAELLKIARSINPVAYWSYSFSSQKLSCSDELFSLLDIPKDTDLQSPEVQEQLFPVSEREKIADFIRQIEEKHKNPSLLLQHTFKDGSSRFFDIRARFISDSNENMLSIAGNMSDITASHYEIQKLKKNDELYRNLFSRLSDIFIIFELVKDSNGKVIDYIYRAVNPAYERKFQVNSNEIINQPLSFQYQLFEQFNPYFKMTALTGQAQQDRVFVQSIDLFLDVLIYAPSPDIIATLWRDVSLIVQADSSLRESEEKYRQIFHIGNDALFVIDFKNGNIIDVNPSGCKMLAYSKEKLINRPFNELTRDPEASKQMIVDRKLTQFVCELVTREGNIFPAEATLAYFNWGGRRVITIAIRDISRRVSEQNELIKSEKKYKQLFDYSNDALLIIRNYRIIDFNRKAIQLFGGGLHSLENKTLWNISPERQKNGEDSRLKVVELMQMALQGRQLESDWLFLKEDRTTFYADLRLSSVLFENEKLIHAVVRDISPRKEIEEALLLKENRWKEALDLSHTGVWDWNVVTNEIFYSATWKKIIGYEADEIPNRFEEFEKRVHPDDIAAVYNKIDAYLTAKTLDFNVTFRFRCKNGSYKWINSRGKIFTYNHEGKPERFLGTQTDITRHIIERDQLEQNNRQYLVALDWLNVGFWELNLKTMLFEGSNNTFSLFGINNQEQVSLRQIQSQVHPEDQDDFIAQFIEPQQQDVINHSFRIITENTTRYINAISRPISDHGRRLSGYRGIFQDITHFRKEELRSKEEQQLIRGYLEKNNQTIIIYQDQELVFINEKFTELTGFKPDEYNTGEIPFLDLVVPEDKPLVKRIYDNIMNQGQSKEEVEIRIETKFKRSKWVELLLAPVRYKGRTAALAIINDINRRKLKEMEMSQVLNRFKAIAADSTNGIAVIDEHNNLVYHNNEFSELSGYREKTRSKNEFLHLFSEEERQRVSNDIANIRQGSAAQSHSETLLNNKLWISIRMKMLPSADDEKKWLVVYLENIDLFKSQIDLLTEENFLFKSMIDQAITAIGLFNQDQELIVYNQPLLKLMEIDLLEQSVITFNHLYFIENNVAVNFNEAINSQNALHFEQQRSPNKTIFVEMKPVELISSKALYVVVRDITDKVETSENLQRALQHYRTLFEQAPVGTALIDNNRNIIACNEQYAAILGANTDQLINMRLDQLVETSNLSDLVNNFSELFSGVTPEIQHDISLLSLTGERRWISAKASPFKDQFNEIVMAIQSVEDITSRKEEESQQLNRQRLQTLNYIGNSFAHLFNNLLMAIYGNAYLLKSNTQDQQLNRYAAGLFNALHKATDHTQKLLSFSQNHSRIKVLTRVSKMFDELISENKLPLNINLKTRFDHDSDTLLCDPSQLQRSLQNIIDNAVESMPRGGTITISTQSVYFDQVPGGELQKLNRGKYLRIKIGDEGHGIGKNDIGKIFDPFYTTRNNDLNSGLGLTIAQKIISEHGGMITVESAMEKSGTNIFLYLPQYDKDEIANSIQPDEQFMVKGTANIMIVDDEDVVRIVTGELIKKLGYNVLSFSEGEKAIRFFKENRNNIDLVILDKHMPGMDGSEVFAQLRELNSTVKIVLLTGYNIDRELLETFNRPNSKIVQKPVSIEKLSHAISALLIDN